jgi:hypothetical protein
VATLLERIQSHRKSLDARYIDVPEWGDEGKPLRIYARPETLEDFGQLAAASERGFDNLVFETLKRLAVDVEGNKMFSGIGFTEFKKMAHGPIAVRVATFLRESVSVKEAEGNSEASPD